MGGLVNRKPLGGRRASRPDTQSLAAAVRGAVPATCVQTDPVNGRTGVGLGVPYYGYSIIYPKLNSITKATI